MRQLFLIFIISSFFVGDLQGNNLYDKKKQILADSIASHLTNYIVTQAQNIVDDNFSILAIPRILYHSLVVSDEKRKVWWNQKLSEYISIDSINSIIKITIIEDVYTNKKNKEILINKLCKKRSSVNNMLSEELYSKIKEREDLEWKDIVFSFATWLLTIIIACIALIPIVALFDEASDNTVGCFWVFVAILSSITSFYISYKYIIVESIEIESQIETIIIEDSYMLISAFNIFESI